MFIASSVHQFNLLLLLLLLLDRKFSNERILLMFVSVKAYM